MYLDLKEKKTPTAKKSIFGCFPTLLLLWPDCSTGSKTLPLPIVRFGLGWKETTLDKFWSGERESVKKSYFHSCPSLFSPSCLNSWNQSLYWNLKLIVVKVLGWIDNDRTNFSLNYWHHENMLAFVKTNRSNPDDYSSIAATKNNSHNPSHANCQSVTLSQHIFVISLLIFYKTQFQKNSFFEETNFSQTTKQFKPRFAAAGWIRILLILYATIVSRWFSYYEA